MGTCALRELRRLRETTLVSVRAYDKSKHGMDAGALIGAAPMGVRVTTDVNELLAEKPEVVLHTAQYYPQSPPDDDIVMLLKAGINVITALPYQYPKSRGLEYVKLFDEAGKAGGATLFGTGINPGFVYERLAPLMTGISNDIQCIRLDEFFNCEQLKNGAEILRLYGFGSTPEEIEKNPVAASIASHFLPVGMHYLADKLGLPLDRIERTSHHGIVSSDIVIPNVITAKAGSVGTVSYRWTGYSGGKALFVIQVHWYLHESLRPSAAKGNDYWLLEIEGRPSSRLGLEIMGSMKNNQAMLESNPTPGAYFANVIAMIQAIPMVVEAAPGLLIAAMPEVHWKPDMRM